MPVRSQGSKWITHKRKALQRIVDSYDAYICHLTVLSEDRSLKSEVRACLTGYLRKWSDMSVVVGCALYVDVLEPPTLLSLTLQGSDLDIVFGIKQILRSCESLKKGLDHLTCSLSFACHQSQLQLYHSAVLIDTAFSQFDLSFATTFPPQINCISRGKLRKRWALNTYLKS